VPALADRGIYIASESTFYRILRKENMHHHRGSAKAPERESHPQRFNKGIRNWASPSAVALNPTEDIKDNLKNTAI